MKALYQAETGHGAAVVALDEIIESVNLSPELQAFARELVVGAKQKEYWLDTMLAALIPDFDYKRLAAVDRNVMRIAAFEILHMPAIPPAVTINEAVEIVKKYSTAESGKFVNGVLGQVLAQSPKRNWEPPDEPEFAEEAAPEPEEPEIPEVEEIDLDPASPEAAKLARIGGWTLRKPEPEAADEEKA